VKEIPECKGDDKETSDVRVWFALERFANVAVKCPLTRLLADEEKAWSKSEEGSSAL